MSILKIFKLGELLGPQGVFCGMSENHLFLHAVHLQIHFSWKKVVRKAGIM